MTTLSHHPHLFLSTWIALGLLALFGWFPEAM